MQRWFAGFLALATILGVFALRPLVLERFELTLLDWRFRLRGVESPKAPISIVAIDEKSINELGRWPWQRSELATLITELTRLGAMAIGVDIVLSEAEILPSPLIELRDWADEQHELNALEQIESSIKKMDGDRLLAKALKTSPNTVLGYFFHTDARDRSNAQFATAKHDLQSIRNSRVAVVRLPDHARFPILRCSGIESVLPLFHDAVPRVGFVSALLDSDGAVRRSSLVARCGGGYFTSLDLAVLEIIAGQRSHLLGEQSGVNTIRVGKREIATDEGGRILINFRGPSKTFPHISASDVIAGQVQEEELRNRIVLIGPTEPGIQDIQATPFSRAFPGVEVHANVIDNLIVGDSLRRNDFLIIGELALVVILSLLTTLILPKLQGALRGVLWVVAGLIGLFLTAQWLLAEVHMWLHLVYPGLSLLFTYFCVALALTITVESTNRQIRRQFAAYVSPQVVEELTQYPDHFRLGGEHRDLTILFSDINGFSRISEKIGAQETVSFLNTYLTPMANIVMASKGTLDKYIGDGLVAFWGAPLPLDNHILHGCNAALDMLDAVEKLRSHETDLPMQQLSIRIGLHVDRVMVGNMGSSQRFDYTISGDGVNLCARIEELNKIYGTQLIISDAIVEHIGDHFLLRELDRVRVRGRKQSVSIFELARKQPDDSPMAMRFRQYAQALKLYRAKEFRRALNEFEATVASYGDDGPSKAMIERIRSFERTEPEYFDATWSFS